MSDPVFVPQVENLHDLGSPEPNSPASYRAGLAEGFRRGVQAAADLCEQPFDPAWPLFMCDELKRKADAIRALRPEGEK